MITAGPRLDFLVSLVPSFGTLCDEPIMPTCPLWPSVKDG